MPEPRDITGTFHERCPACGTCNRVEVTGQYGLSPSQDYYCAHCGQRLGSLRAADAPATSIADDARCP